MGSLIQFSVKRWVAIVCLMIAITGLGINAYRKLPLEELPRTDMPYITVVTIYPGASPEEIETDCAKRIEDATSSLDGLKSITSSCLDNVCQTLIEFEVGTDVDAAANDIREKIDTILKDFPDGIEKPIVLKYDINAQPIVNLAVTGSLPIDELYEYADNDFKDAIAAIKGVAEVKLTGGSPREVHVLLDRDKLAARGLSSLDVVGVIKKEIKMIPAGRIKHEGAEYTIKFDADYKSLKSLETLEVANKNGQRCTIKDVGQVLMGTEERRQSAMVDKKPCIAVQVIKKSDANAVNVVKLVKAKIEEMQKTLPGGIELLWVSDTGSFIQSSVDNAVSNIWEGIALTAVLMFFFLYNVKSTLTVAITMPLTVIAGVLMMSAMGYTINMATLLAIGLSIGILVTNSIVVLENIVGKVKNGDSSTSAAINGTTEIVMAVLASAGTNVVVLFPVAVMKGQIGQFFIPFAMTMVGVTIVSLFISFTLTPGIAGQIIKNEDNRKSFVGKLEALWNKWFGKFTDACVGIVRKVVNSKPLSFISLLVAVLLLAHAAYLATGLGFSFLPICDRGEMVIKLEYPSTFSLKQTEERTVQIESLLDGIPELAHRLTNIGKIDGSVGQTSEGVYLAQIMCKFVEKTERQKSIFQLRDEITEKLSGISDVIMSTSLPDQGGSGAQIRMVIRGDDFEVLNRRCQELVDKAKKTDWLIDVDSSVRPGKNELVITPKRAVLSDLKVPATTLGMALRTNIEGTKSGTYKENARTYDIRVKFMEKEGLAQVEQLELPGPPGHPIIMRNFTDINHKISPVLITRRNKSHAVLFYANPVGVPLGTAANGIEKMLTEKEPLPAGYSIEYMGKVQMMKDGIADFIEVGVIALVLTYLLLAAILDSFLRPFIILITIPLGFIGIIWFMWLFGESMSMMILLGIVMLIGIVVNNAILIMDRVQVNIDSGMEPKDAMLDAIGHELRAITMVTLAAIIGMIPMALDSGLGSELRTGIGIASIGGILISAVMTMFVLPILYCLFAKKKTVNQ